MVSSSNQRYDCDVAGSSPPITAIISGVSLNGARSNFTPPGAMSKQNRASGTLAKLEQITPQSMGVTLSALESRGLIQRRADPEDGRRAIMSLTRVGRDFVLRNRDVSTEVVARAIAANFTAGEIDQLRDAAALIGRLAQAL